MGCYLYRGDTSTTKRVFAAIGQCPRGAALLVAGDFNFSLVAPEGNRRREEIATAIATAGQEDMSAHFLS